MPTLESPTELVTLDVVTNREHDPATGACSDRRSSELTFESFTISIPPDHEAKHDESYMPREVIEVTVSDAPL